MATREVTEETIELTKPGRPLSSDVKMVAKANLAVRAALPAVFFDTRQYHLANRELAIAKELPKFLLELN